MPRHFRKASAPFDQLASPFDHLALFVVAQLTESFAAADLVTIVGDEPLDAAVQEADSFASAEQQPAADQARLSPAADGLGRHAEHFAQLVNRVDLLADFVDRDIGRIAQVLDQQPQIVLQIGRGDAVPTRRFGPVVGDPETEVVEGVRSIGFDLAVQLFCKASLLDLLRFGCESSELVS